MFTPEETFAIVSTYFIVMIALYVVYMITYWKVFTKAGESGWKCIIPIYNTYMVYKFCWKPAALWIMLALAIAYVCTAVSQSALIPCTSLLCIIAVAVIGIFQQVKLAKAFDKGYGFTLGLIFLGSIFMLMLGFDSSEYNKSKGSPLEVAKGVW